MENTEHMFTFYTRLTMSELLGVKAYTLKELAESIKEVPGAAIYHHTHRFLQQHQYLCPEPPNDFAYWVTNSLVEKVLGERLASIDTVEFKTIRGLRDKIVGEIEAYLKERPTALSKRSQDDDAFHFVKSISFVFPTKHVVKDLEEFADALKEVTVDSLYYHIFESRLRLEKETNDFSNWIRASVGNNKLAEAIDKLDPYTHTLEELRDKIIGMIERSVNR